MADVPGTESRDELTSPPVAVSARARVWELVFRWVARSLIKGLMDGGGKDEDEVEVVMLRDWRRRSKESLVVDGGGLCVFEPSRRGPGLLVVNGRMGVRRDLESDRLVID